MEDSIEPLNKTTFSNHAQEASDERSYGVLFACGHYILVLDAVHPQEGQRFKPELQPNGDIYLRAVDVFNSKNKSRPQQVDDYTEGLRHRV